MGLQYGMSAVSTICCVHPAKKSKDFVKKVFDKLRNSLYNT